MTHPLAVHRRFFDAAHCPECGAGIDGPRARCATCGLVLTGPTATRLAGQLSTADRTMDQLRAESQASVPASAPPRYAMPPVARRSTSISGSAVILGLGGLCLMVAAVVFISVSWGTLTLTDKAAVLGVVTAVLALCSAAVTRKGLRGSAETLWACTVIDLALDLWAVRRTGLAGSGRLTPDAYCSLAATTIALVALACCLLTRRSTLTRPVVSAQVALCLAGVLAVFSALFATRLDPGASLIVSTAVFTGFALAGRRAALWCADAGWLVAATASWLALATVGLTSNASLSLVQSLSAAAGWELLAAVGIAVLVTVVPHVLPRDWQRLGAATAGVALAAAVVAQDVGQRLDGPATAAVVLVLLTALGLVRRRPWQAAITTVLGLVSVGAWAVLALDAVSGVGVSLSSADGIWVDTAGHRAVAIEHQPMLSMLLLLLTSGVVVAVRCRELPDGVGRWTGAAVLPVGVGLFAIAQPPVLVLSSGWLLAATAVLLLSLTLADRRLLWPAGTSLGIGLIAALTSDASSAVAFTAGAGLVLLASRGGVARWRTGAELFAAAEASVAVAAVTHALGLQASTAAVAGLLATATMLGTAAVWTPARRWWRWLALAALTAALWTEAAQHSIHAPELYSVPFGLLLLGIGVDAGHRDRSLTSWQSTGLGLLVLTVPSLLPALDDPVSWRAVALGLAALGILLIGANGKRQAALVVGAVELAVLVLREVSPYAAAMPRWSAIGSVGVLLIVIGVSWENRVQNLRTMRQRLLDMH